MSEGTEQPHTDPDAWAAACAEDLAREKARRRQAEGWEPGSAADELRRLAEAVTAKVAELRSPAAAMAAQTVISQMKAAVGPLRERNPELFEHLSAAGAELLAAYRVAVQGQESRWTRAGGDRPGGPEAGSDRSGPEHIDLD